MDADACPTGLTADGRILIDKARIECQSHRLTVEDPVSIEYITKHIAGIQQVSVVCREATCAGYNMGQSAPSVVMGKEGDDNGACRRSRTSVACDVPGGTRKARGWHDVDSALGYGERVWL